MKAICIKDFYTFKSKYKPLFKDGYCYHYEEKNESYMVHNIKMNQITFSKHFKILS